MKRALLGIAVYTLASFCHATPDFAGTYKCKGFDPYLDKTYAGTIKISPQSPVYRLEMEYDSGYKSLGTGGLYDNNTIAVVFQDTRDPTKVGLERYSYSLDHKTIQGYWVYLGHNKLGAEVCKKIPQKPINTANLTKK